MTERWRSQYGWAVALYKKLYIRTLPWGVNRLCTQLYTVNIRMCKVRIMISTRQGTLRKYQDRAHMWYNSLYFSIRFYLLSRLCMSSLVEVIQFTITKAVTAPKFFFSFLFFFLSSEGKGKLHPKSKLGNFFSPFLKFVIGA